MATTIYATYVSTRDDENAQFTHVWPEKPRKVLVIRCSFNVCLVCRRVVFALCYILYPTHAVQLQIDELDTEQQKHDISLYTVKRCLLYCLTLVFDDESVPKPNSRPYANNCHSFKLNNNNKQLQCGAANYRFSVVLIAWHTVWMCCRKTHDKRLSFGR